ncbi:hypothetical protein [Acidicapsa ligni]|uniref:hypothetical protein n=1 Tax=Acidicapsa ligni TaxID=542300 RepID=UPI0021DF589D|nr:hypothetical protein [Acidicapsa ligni]
MPDNPPLAAVPSDFQFTGTWDCAGTFRTNQVHKAVFAAGAILGEKWLEITERDLVPSTGYLAKYLIGYDPQQKALVEYDANNFSTAVYTSTEGWKNGVLTMTSAVTDDPKAPYVANRFIYTINGADSFTIDWKISKTTPLNFVSGDHLVCKRRPNV